MKSKDRKTCLETQGQNTIVIKASHFIHGTRVMRRFTQVARFIARQYSSRQLLDPVSFEPSPLPAMLCWSGSGAPAIVGSLISVKCRLQSRIGKFGLNYPGGSKRNE